MPRTPFLGGNPGLEEPDTPVDHPVDSEVNVEVIDVNCDRGKKKKNPEKLESPPKRQKEIIQEKSEKSGSTKSGKSKKQEKSAAEKVEDIPVKSGKSKIQENPEKLESPPKRQSRRISPRFAAQQEKMSEKMEKLAKMEKITETREKPGFTKNIKKSVNSDKTSVVKRQSKKVSQKETEQTATTNEIPESGRSKKQQKNPSEIIQENPA